MKEITPLQEKILEIFRKSPLSKKFYWTGGTALAFFYLHQRIKDYFIVQSQKYLKRHLK